MMTAREQEVYDIIVRLYEQLDRKVTIPEILDETNTSRSNVYRIVYKLRDKGYIECDHGITPCKRKPYNFTALSALAKELIDHELPPERNLINIVSSGKRNFYEFEHHIYTSLANNTLPNTEKIKKVLGNRIVRLLALADLFEISINDVIAQKLEAAASNE